MKKTLIATILIACGAAAVAQVSRPPGTPMPKPRPGTPPGSTSINTTQARIYADRGDARTLQQAQAYADVGDARTVDAAAKNTADQFAGLQREAAAGIAQSAAIIHIEPWADGQTTVNVGAATYSGQTALGLAVARQVGSTTLNFGLGTSGSGRNVVRVGMGWRF